MPTFRASSADEWADAASRSFVPLSIGWVGHGFTGSIDRRNIGGGVRVCKVVADPHQADRTTRLAAASASEDLIFSVQTAGVGHVRQRQRSTTLSLGSGTLYATAVPYALDYRTPMTSLVCQLPRQRLALSDRELHAAAARPVTVESTALRVYTAFAESVFEESAALSGAGGDGVSEALTALLDGVLESLLAGPGRPRGSSSRDDEALLATMRGYIAEHLDDPGLGVVSIATRHGISVRRMRTVFSALDTSPEEYIRRRRLARAARLLTGAAGRQSMVGDIAVRCGFNDVATFTRAFKRQYGLPPARWREQATRETP
jgi:AraC-like DNA-binding protein